MARRNCKHPDACVAGSRGPCRKCSDLSANAERMRKLHADPEFAAAHAERAAERMHKLNADPEFAAAHAARAAERMRKLNADKRDFTIPDHLRDSYNLARRKGFSPREAIKIAEVS